MQFLIVAHDGPGMLDKRLAVRDKHLENMTQMKEHVICAGGILDENGKMAGSSLVLDFENREQFDEYLKSEPYFVEKVWQDIKVEQLNVVIVNGEKVGK